MSPTDIRNKEQVYDEDIYPLVAQIAAICETHNIATIIDFEIPTEKDDGLVVTTILMDETERNSLRHRKMIIYGGLSHLTNNKQKE